MILAIIINLLFIQASKNEFVGIFLDAFYRKFIVRKFCDNYRSYYYHYHS